MPGGGPDSQRHGGVSGPPRTLQPDKNSVSSLPFHIHDYYIGAEAPVQTNFKRLWVNPHPPDRSSYSVEEQMVRVSAEDRTDNIFGIDTCRNMQLCNAAIPHWVLTILNDCSRYVSRCSLMNSPTQTTVRQLVSFEKSCSTSSVFDWLVQGKIFCAVNASRRKWQINTEKRRNTLVSAHLNQCPEWHLMHSTHCPQCHRACLCPFQSQVIDD